MKKQIGCGCLLSAFVFFIAILFVIRMLDDQADINIGLKHLDDVRAFNKVFPDHYEKITGMGLFWGNESWVSMTVAYDRYIVRMLFDLDIGFFSFGKNRLRKDSQVSLSISEAHIDSYIGLSIRRMETLNFDVFPEIEHIDELFELAGLEPIKGQPVAGVEDYVRRSTHTK